MTLFEVIFMKLKEEVKKDMAFYEEIKLLDERIETKMLELNAHNTWEERHYYYTSGRDADWRAIDDKLMDELLSMKCKRERLINEFRGA